MKWLPLKARLPFEKVCWATEHLHKGWKHLRKLRVALRSPLGAKIISETVRKNRAKINPETPYISPSYFIFYIWRESKSKYFSAGESVWAARRFWRESVWATRVLRRDITYPTTVISNYSLGFKKLFKFSSSKRTRGKKRENRKKRQ